MIRASQRLMNESQEQIYAVAFTLFLSAMLFFTSAIARFVFGNGSGVTLTVSMPSSTRN